MTKVRALVVDDSFFMRKLISDLLSKSGLIEVVDTAKDGIEAIDKIKKLKPDVVTLDVEMPRMNGLEALEQIMKNHPVPIIMVSSLTKTGTDTTIHALQLGAFDFIAKPSGAISFDIAKVKDELVDKILIAYRQKEKWIRQWNINKKGFISIRNQTQKYIEQLKDNQNIQGIVAIGTSTGGPKALQEVVTKLPKNIPYAILIVQHMPAGFTKSLATRLDSISEIHVVEAEDKQALQPGTAYIAPGDYHMVVERQSNQYFIRLNQNDPVGGHRPSVDVLFKSLSDVPLNKVMVIMTGMGSDGTKGLQSMHKDGNVIRIAEDESTCVVFGMPKSAIKSGVIDMIVPLYDIANKIVETIQKQRGWQSWN
ncbi:protein-glutamate methylesterase/protein-glutamine glutaminase [Tepidibacillus fermentans]|uniref:Protein-glutamate methylesterase/protein-glutamine glutaminase n=1 Tax=Tepidibacillus fermentans TaxID=1281767 RepID=A0A4R3KHT6_9BACI|nr:chemotaxis response regulator protein-glutamate methylesterase [Tepidibacillus fermentans]TCS82958.1 two-component system chemotaxis response regulator CheB [Tepidibacillus fermentans]